MAAIIIVTGIAAFAGITLRFTSHVALLAKREAHR